MRRFLNGTFCQAAFNEEEQQGLIQMGSDKVTLLTESEAIAYFPSEKSREVRATPYLIAKTNGGCLAMNGNASWGLRIEGQNKKYTFITGIGLISSPVHPRDSILNGVQVNIDSSIRPVIKVSTKTLIMLLSRS